MKEIAPHRNNLPLLFLHNDVAPTGGIGGRWHGRLAGLRIRWDLCSVVGVQHSRGWQSRQLLQLCVTFCSCMRWCFSYSTMSGEDNSIGIWWPRGRSPTNVPQSLGFVACDDPVHWLEKHLWMWWCSPRSMYGGYSPLSSTLPWWRRMVMDDVFGEAHVSPRVEL
jgi:hypothetical protein